MAITITTSPNGFIGAFNQVVYTISSNNTAQPNFNFIIDVKQTSTNVLLARLKYPKQPGVNTLTFDIGNVLQNYVSYDFNNVVGNLGTNNNSRIKYYVEFRELFDNASGIPTLSGLLAINPTGQSASIFKLASNAIFDFEDFTPTAFINNDIATIGYLSNTQIENINTNQERFLYWFDPLRLALKIRYVDSTNTNEDVAISLTAQEYLFSIKAGKYAQDAIIAAGLTLTNNYKVQLLDVSNNVLATKTFNLNTECSNYPIVRLHYMNKLGGFESFNFIRNSRKSEEIERKQFKAPLPIGYSKQDRLKTNYNTTINDSININSDWVSEEQSILLEQLATSPVIYLERSETEFVAVNITNTSYEIKTFSTDRRLFNISFDIEFTYSRYRQSL